MEQQPGQAALDPDHKAVTGEAPQETGEADARGGETPASADFCAAPAFLADPIDAFFYGIGSTFFRVFWALAAAFFAYLLHGLCHSGSMMHPLFFPFAAIMTAGSWGLHGFWFPVGFGALLAGMFMAYRFAMAEGGKLLWFAIFASFFVYFLPVNFSRRHNYGGGNLPDLIREHNWIGSLLLFALVAGMYFLVPTAIAALLNRRRTE